MIFGPVFFCDFWLLIGSVFDFVGHMAMLRCLAATLLICECGFRAAPRTGHNCEGPMLYHQLCELGLQKGVGERRAREQRIA